MRWFFQELYERNYEAARVRLAAAPSDLLGYWPKALLEGWVLDLLGEPRAAAASYERARIVLEELLAGSTADADLHNARTHGFLGLALAGLGRVEDAVREGRRAAELSPISEDATVGPWGVLDQALIDIAVGRHDAALDRLEYLLSIPAGWQISVPLLELDPRWDPLRSHPRYREIVAGAIHQPERRAKRAPRRRQDSEPADGSVSGGPSPRDVGRTGP